MKNNMQSQQNKSAPIKSDVKVEKNQGFQKPATPADKNSPNRAGTSYEASQVKDSRQQSSGQQAKGDRSNR